MTLISDIVIFVCAWWLLFFPMLTIGIRVPEDQEQGHATSAPENPRILLRIIITTVLAVIIWWLIRTLIQADIYSFRP